MRLSWICAVGIVLLGAAAGPRAGGQVTTAPTPEPDEARALSRSFAEVAQSIAPSVVRIEVVDTEEDAIGSGIILDTRGDVVTSSHLFDGWSARGAGKGSRGIAVILVDGRRLAAELVGVDDRSDVAIVRMTAPPHDSSAARFGDSDGTVVGEWVLAVGSPLGLDQTITAGIISGRPRVDDSGSSARRGYLLTDAKVNPGDSGGPLVDLTGQVIGLTTLISAGPGGSYAYAVPINRVRRVAVALIRDGHAEHPYIGVGLRDPRDVDPTELASLGAAPPHGALVSRVWRDAPAGRAGLRRGDVITSLNNREVPGPADLVELIDEQEVGARVTIGFVRDGSNRSVLLAVEDLPPVPVARRGESRAPLTTTVSSVSGPGRSPIEFR
jgi:S1-C subfamily serine protease